MGLGLRELYFCLIYLSFFVWGAVAPFALALGYCWVDLYYPQALSDYLGAVPIAFIIGAAAVGIYIVRDRRDPHASWQTGLVLLMTVWSSMTMMWAEVPVFAAEKWNWAFKTMAFSAFLPLVLRSRIQIEAFIHVFFFSAAAYMFPVAVKTLLTGGGYEQRVGLVNTNAGFAESSELATVCIMLLPLALFLKTHSSLLPKIKLRDFGFLGLAFLSVFGAVGTYARTAVVGFAIVGIGLLAQVRNKLTIVVAGGIVSLMVIYTATNAWDSRISTIDNYDEENSAYTRILVWKWTLGYIATHPLGGGFNSYAISRIEFPAKPGQLQGDIVVGRAFHSSYFEVLGETGIPGIMIFLAIIGVTLYSLQRVIIQTRNIADLLWAFDLAKALRTAFLVLLGCSAFIGIAFQPIYWYTFAIVAALQYHVRRVLAVDAPPRFQAITTLGPRLPEFEASRRPFA